MMSFALVCRGVKAFVMKKMPSVTTFLPSRYLHLMPQDSLLQSLQCGSSPQNIVSLFRLTYGVLEHSTHSISEPQGLIFLIVGLTTLQFPSSRTPHQAHLPFQQEPCKAQREQCFHAPIQSTPLISIPFSSSRLEPLDLPDQAIPQDATTCPFPPTSSLGLQS